MKGTEKWGSLFINILIKKMIVEWYFIVFLLCFIYVISEVKINYNENLYLRMFILLFFIFVFIEWNENIKWVYFKIWMKLLLLTLLWVHFFNNYFYFHFTCVGIGVLTPAQLDGAMGSCIGKSGSGTFRKYYYIILYLFNSIHYFFDSFSFLNRFIPMSLSFFLPYFFQREPFSRSARRYLFFPSLMLNYYILFRGYWRWKQSDSYSKQQGRDEAWTSELCSGWYQNTFYNHKYPFRWCLPWSIYIYIIYFYLFISLLFFFFYLYLVYQL
jgi:hypothetical protein